LSMARLWSIMTFAFLLISGDAPGKRYPQEALSRQSSRARQDPCRRMSCLVEQVRLDHKHRSNLSGSLPRRGLRSAR
jgi:hypothetical protein